MKDTKNIVVIANYLALAVVLDVVKNFLPFLNMPSGGSINIALIPIVLCSFHLGCKCGFIAGSLWFILSSILGLNKYFVSFGQIIFDYILPSTIIGFSSLFYKKRKLIEIEIGIILTMLIRTFSICLSGAVYWFDDSCVSSSLNAWIGSFVYNVPYSIATLIMLLIIIPILLKTLKKFMYN